MKAMRSYSRDGDFGKGIDVFSATHADTGERAVVINAETPGAPVEGVQLAIRNPDGVRKLIVALYEAARETWPDHVPSRGDL